MNTNNTTTRKLITLPNDCDAIKEFLEDMALKGWKLRSVYRFTFYFEKIEPKKLNYSVDVFPSISFLDTNPTKETLDYIEYCKEAGWIHICTNRFMNYFVSDSFDIPPVSTSDAEKFELICSAYERLQAPFITTLLNGLLALTFAPGLIKNILIFIVLTCILFLSSLTILKMKQKKRIEMGLTIQFGTYQKLKIKQLCYWFSIAVFTILVLFIYLPLVFIDKEPFAITSVCLIGIWFISKFIINKLNLSRSSRVFYTYICFFIGVVLYAVIITMLY